LAVDADGVHLGQEDLPYAVARKVMGPNKLIGLSTHNADQVREADLLKPDYIGFGPIFKPGSKKNHDPIVGISGLRAIRSLTSLPIFAIGGIQFEQVGEVMLAGANGIAVISAVLKAEDIKQVVSDFLSQMS
jgi:thiamine-phosphate pyrophosphorylase